MNGKQTTGARSQRGRIPQKRRASSMNLVYVIIAVVVVAGLALAGLAALGDPSTPAGQAGQAGLITSTIPLDSLPARGKADAPVTVIEFGDFQCPACGYFATQLEPAFTKDYIDTGKVRLLFHDFPLSQHRNAVISAEAARSAGDQGKYWEMHDLLYARQSEWSESPQPETLFATYAQQLGLDVNQFTQALSSHKHRADVQAAGTAAGRAGVSSTPTFVIDGKPYDYNQLRGAIDAALNK
jgi:protein-disulfide isomerase